MRARGSCGEGGRSDGSEGRREEERRAGECKGLRVRGREGGSQRFERWGGEQQARARERTRKRTLGEGGRLGVPLATNFYFFMRKQFDSATHAKVHVNAQ